MGSSAIGPLGLSARTSALEVREDQMLHDMQAQTGLQDRARIEKGAKEFEAMLLSSWLQQAEQSFATVPGSEDDEESVGRDQMMSLGVQSLAQTMANSGGIGIAKMIAKSLEAAAEKAQSGPGMGPVR